MPGRDETAAFLGIDIERAAGIKKRHQLGPRIQGAAPGHHQRAPCLRDQGGSPFHGRGVGRNAPRRAWREVLGQRKPRRHRPAQHVGRYLDVNRAWRIAVADRSRPGLVEIAQQVVGDAQRARTARHRPHHADMVDALQRAEVVLRNRRAAANQQHRHALELRIGHRGHAVGHARPGGHHRDADPAAQHGIGMRHVDCGAFVAHVDDAHALAAEPVPDRLDVSALQAVDPVHAVRDQEVGHPLGHRLRCVGGGCR